MEKLAIHGGKPYKSKPFPQWPKYDESEINLVNEVFASGNWWRVTGTKVSEFEEKFAEMQGAEYCLGVTNGTSAIELCLTALGIGKGDEVIVPAMTFISTGLSVLRCNAVPVLVDVDSDTYCMLPEAFEAAISKKTKAVIPVHMAGHACDMDQICSIANSHKIKVIEDAAHGPGGEFNGKRFGSFGDAAIFSFQNGKIMTCGEGGALVTKNKELYDRAYLIQDVGRPRGDKIYSHVLMGANYRMNEFQAAILLAQMQRVDEMNQLREKNAKILDKLLANVEGINPQGRKESANIMTHYMYMFSYDSSCFGGLERNAFVEALIAEGIPACVCFPVLSDTEFFTENSFEGRIDVYDKLNEGNLANSRKIADHVIWLHHRTLEGDHMDLEEIVGAIKKIQNAYNECGWLRSLGERMDKGVILDFDGVIINSCEVQKLALMESYRIIVGEGSPSFDEFFSYSGDSLDNIFRQMGLPLSMVEHYNRISSENLNSIFIYEGMLELLNYLKSHDYKIGLCTGKNRKRTLEILKKMNLESYFDTVICSDDVKNPKPFPDSLELAIKSMNILDKENVVMIGDATNDIKCAKSTNVKSIGVTWGGVEKKILEAAEPDYIADDITELKSLIELIFCCETVF